MDKPTKNDAPEDQLNSPNTTPVERTPATGRDNQVYGQSQANVQPQHEPVKQKGKEHFVDSWPTWTKIVFFPIFAVLFVGALIADLFLLGGGFSLPGSKGFWGTTQLIVTAVFLAFAINTFVFQSYEVVGESMLPTLNNGDRLVISKLGKTWGNTFGSDYVPARGDIIVFDSPSNQNRQLIKRVIGLPGEKVIVNDGEITVINDAFPDGFDPDTNYKDTLPPDTSNQISTEVPDGEIFVAGDNRLGGSSLDSRNSLGTVPIENVVGSLVLRILPFDAARFF